MNGNVYICKRHENAVCTTERVEFNYPKLLHPSQILLSCNGFVYIAGGKLCHIDSKTDSHAKLLVTYRVNDSKDCLEFEKSFSFAQDSWVIQLAGMEDWIIHVGTLPSKFLMRRQLVCKLYESQYVDIIFQCNSRI